MAYGFQRSCKPTPGCTIPFLKGCIHNYNVRTILPFRRLKRCVLTATNSGRGKPSGIPSQSDGGRKRVAVPREEQRRAELQQQARQATRMVENVAKKRLAVVTGKGPTRTEGLVPFVDLVAPGGENDLEEEDEASNQERRSAKASRSRGAKRTAAIELLTAYKNTFQAALDCELQEEWAASEERLKSWSRTRLEEEGMALFALGASQAGTLFQDALLRFCVRGGDEKLPFHNISQGDVVLISRGRPLDDDSVEGVVLDYSTRWLRVAVPSIQASGIKGGGWRLDLYANTAAYERSSAAIKEFTRPDRPRSSSSAGAAPDTAHLLRLLSGNVPAGEHQRHSSW